MKIACLKEKWQQKFIENETSKSKETLRMKDGRIEIT